MEGSLRAEGAHDVPADGEVGVRRHDDRHPDGAACRVDAGVGGEPGQLPAPSDTDDVPLGAVDGRGHGEHTRVADVDDVVDVGPGWGDRLAVEGEPAGVLGLDGRDEPPIG